MSRDAISLYFVEGFQRDVIRPARVISLATVLWTCHLCHTDYRAELQ